MACPSPTGKRNCACDFTHVVLGEVVRYGGSVRGDFWTVTGHLSRALTRAPLPPAQHVTFVVPDARFGQVCLTARLTVPRNATTLLVLVHGLGGSSQSKYLCRATSFANDLGVATLRLNLRGADLRGEDFYHAALSSDLHAVLQHQRLGGFAHVVLLGYSLGGHMALCYASEAHDARLRKVATLCSPLDLSLCAGCFDSARSALYRSYVLRSLKAMYREVNARRALPLSDAEVERIDSIREWDERVVAPRHGFAGADDYYARSSAGPKLGRIETPTLFAYARHDPMVPISTMGHALAGRSSQLLTWEIERGGHIGFPRGPSLPSGIGVPQPQAVPQGVDEQLVAWLCAT